MGLSNSEACPHCGRYANRGVTIDAIIVKNDSVLLIKRGAEPFKGYWGLPGGYVNWDETVSEAVSREVKEELGVEVVSSTQIGVYSDPARHPRQCIDISYAVEIEGTPVANDDAQECKYFPFDSLPELAFDHRKLITDFLELKGR